MKRLPRTVIVATALFAILAGDALADGLIHQVPVDGSWVQFEVTGAGLKPNGDVSTKITGTVTVKSVGSEEVEGAACRWIELETELAAEADRGAKGKQSEVFKLLIPTQYLVAGQNPIEHVLKAWKSRNPGGGPVELDLKGSGSRDVRSLDELLNGGISDATKREDVELMVPGGTFRCTQLEGKTSSKARDVDVEIQTWLNTHLPFGVAAYRHSKMRTNGGQSQGGRWMELKFAKSGADAKSAIDK